MSFLGHIPKRTAAGQSFFVYMNFMLADWNQIVQEIKAFAEIMEPCNDMVSFQLANI